MSETFNHKGIIYSVEYIDHLDHWEWRFDCYVGTKNISDSGIQQTKINAQFYAEREIDWRISMIQE